MRALKIVHRVATPTFGSRMNVLDINNVNAVVCTQFQNNPGIQYQQQNKYLSKEREGRNIKKKSNKKEERKQKIVSLI